MGQVEPQASSAETDKKRPSTQSDAYISPLIDFLVLFVLTAATAATVLVVL